MAKEMTMIRLDPDLKHVGGSRQTGNRSLSNLLVTAAEAYLRRPRSDDTPRLRVEYPPPVASTTKAETVLIKNADGTSREIVMNVTSDFEPRQR